ncbi:ubiquitin-protein transferase [Aureococcus anophagefferens]|nr:ubiquitin-protein transferase [Aureococcus anophagefferens]
MSAAPPAPEPADNAARTRALLDAVRFERASPAGPAPASGRYDAAYAHVLPPRDPGDYLPESALTYDALLALDRPAAPSKAAVATKKQLISKALTTSVYRKPAEPTGEEDNECCICLDEFEDEERIKKLRCGHLFHLNCIKKWLLADMRCPTCRQPVADAAPG